MGMFLRLALIQFQTTLPDQLLESREEIETRVSSFVGELNTAQRDLADWRVRAVFLSRRNRSKPAMHLQQVLLDLKVDIVRAVLTRQCADSTIDDMVLVQAFERGESMEGVCAGATRELQRASSSAEGRPESSQMPRRRDSQPNFTTQKHDRVRLGVRERFWAALKRTIRFLTH
jgi:hypothetical protein